MFLSLGLFFVYAPLFLVSFILSIVAMAQRRVAGGIILLLFTLTLPLIFFIGLISYHVSEMESSKAMAIARCKIEEPKANIDGNYMYFKGKIRNDGDTTVDFVKVKVEWLDDNKNVLDSDWTYAVSGEGLRPGAAKTFEIMSPADRRMKQYRYWVEK